MAFGTAVPVDLGNLGGTGEFSDWATTKSRWVHMVQNEGSQTEIAETLSDLSYQLKNAAGVAAVT